jgi:hypothetical protein
LGAAIRYNEAKTDHSHKSPFKEMKFVPVLELHPAEKRTYMALWIACLLCWLGGFAAWLWSAQTLPWVPIAAAGSVGAVLFGLAVRYRSRVWPFSLFWPSPKIVGSTQASLGGTLD